MVKGVEIQRTFTRMLDLFNKPGIVRVTVQKRRHHITSDSWKHAKLQSHTNEIITLLPKPKMVWIQVDSGTYRKLHNPRVITKREFVGT